MYFNHNGLILFSLLFKINVVRILSFGSKLSILLIFILFHLLTLYLEEKGFYKDYCMLLIFYLRIWKRRFLLQLLRNDSCIREDSFDPFFFIKLGL